MQFVVCDTLPVPYTGALRYRNVKMLSLMNYGIGGLAQGMDFSFSIGGSVSEVVLFKLNFSPKDSFILNR